MNNLSNGERKELELYTSRTLDADIPELKPYLKPGARVLDVGCGAGTITLGVARIVETGQVVGVDPVAYRVATASQLAKQQSLSNVTFEVGDGNHLRFPDHSFEIVYSHTVLHYFWDPERALKEQKRVTEKGGWVIAAGVRDWGLVRRYPPCPNWDKVLEARIAYCQTGPDRLHRLGPPPRPCLGHTQAARKCPEWFVAAGLADVHVEVKAYKLEYSGAEEMNPGPMDLLPWAEVDDFGYHADYALEYQAMIAEGFLDGQTLKEALKEARAWFKNPRAFHFYAMVFAAGKAVGE